jgi:shikimate dehydrogenase
VLGAGGAGRAVAWALREAGAAAVMVWNRTPERAVDLARELGVDAVGSPAAAEIVVNATAVGIDATGAADAGATGRLQEEALAALGLDRLPPPEVVIDLVYAEAETPVVGWGRRAGARTVAGLEVLVRQGARSFERWTEREAPLEVMRAAARGG